MIRRGLEFVARFAPVLATLWLVASCGSGAVSGVPPVNDPTKVTILPGTPTVMYSGLPTTFSITGGTGAYIVSSSNQAIVPVLTNLIGSTLTVVPNNVTTDTDVTLTARDTGTATPASVIITVRPGTVSNLITITPGSSACSPAICSGGDAVVAATISQGGIPLAARGVRFEVVSGDFLFITSPVGAPETLAAGVATATDETGVARARLRAGVSANNQTGILQVTDIGSGAYQRTTLLIARTSSTQSGFFTVPTTIDYTGPDSTHCATGPSSEIFVFGGAPPYTLSNSAPEVFSTNTTVVSTSGGSFRVSPTGTCADSVSIAITDAAARTISVTLSNKVGTAVAPTALSVIPSAVTLNSCSATASSVIIGGKGSGYVAAPSSNIILATVNGSLLTVSRAPGPLLGTPVTSASVVVSDGTQTSTVQVTLTGTASTGPCP